MADVKFSDDERDAVVRSLEKLRGIKITRIGSKKKFFKGTDNLHYCIIGGRDDWHEIPEEVMTQEKESSKSVFLVIARWLKTKIEVYGG